MWPFKKKPKGRIGYYREVFDGVGLFNKGMVYSVEFEVEELMRLDNGKSRVKVLAAYGADEFMCAKATDLVDMTFLPTSRIVWEVYE